MKLVSKSPPYVPIKLYSPESYKKATKGELELWTNGCGSAQAKFDFVPDTIWFLSIKEACRIHDWMYHMGRTAEDKEEADRVFLYNMLRIINARSKSKFLKRWRCRRAHIYYTMVVWRGGPAFWDPINEAAATT